MHGLHLTADLAGCPPRCAPMTSIEALRGLCLDAVAAAGLTPVGELFHRFPVRTDGALDAAGASSAGPGGGITGVVLLAESHLAVHTWPELRAVTLDVYVCNLGADNSARAEALLRALIEAFAPGRIERQAIERGRLGAAHASTRAA